MTLRRLLAVLLVPAVLVAVAWLLLRNSSVRVEREVYVMGTTLTATVEAPRDRAGHEAIEAALHQIRRMDDLLSTWDSATPMSRLNRAPVGESVAVAAELLDLLVDAERWAVLTGRAFEPAVGPLVDAWDLRGDGRRPTDDELTAAVASLRGGFAFDVGEGYAIRRNADVWIDTGAFGKGAALAVARDTLLALGVERAALDFGGQVLAMGAPEGQEGWRIGIAHPARRDEVVGRLEVRDVSVATSGASERFITVDGERLGHLLDPRNGRPVPAWGSVTVVSKDPFAADALSTALYVVGPEEGMAWAREQAGVGVLFVVDGPEGLVSHFNEAMRPWLREIPGTAAAEPASPDSVATPSDQPERSDT